MVAPTDEVINLLCWEKCRAACGQDAQVRECGCSLTAEFLGGICGSGVTRWIVAGCVRRTRSIDGLRRHRWRRRGRGGCVWKTGYIHIEQTAFVINRIGISAYYVDAISRCRIL